MDSHVPEFFACNLADTWKPFNRQWQEKGINLLRLNDKQTVRLAPVRSQLGKKFIRRHSSRSCQVQFLANLFTNRARHQCCRWETQLVLGDIEVCLIQRQGLNQIGMPFQDDANAARHGAIPGKIRSDKDRGRAQTASAERGHGGTYTESPGLIRGSAHNRALALPGYDYGLPSQVGIVPLLDGSVERIHVDV